MTHICVCRLTITGSDNGLTPGRRQAIIWTNAGILLIGPLGTNVSENFIEFAAFSFTKMRFKLSSAKWRPFCLRLNVSKSLFPMWRFRVRDYNHVCREANKANGHIDQQLSVEPYFDLADDRHHSWTRRKLYHYIVVIISVMASQITGVSVVFTQPLVHPQVKDKHQKFASLASMRGIRRWPVDSPHKGPVHTCLAFIHIGRYDIKARRHLACVQNGITQLGDWRMETWQLALTGSLSCLHPPISLVV